MAIVSEGAGHGCSYSAQKEDWINILVLMVVRVKVNHLAPGG